MSEKINRMKGSVGLLVLFAANLLFLISCQDVSDRSAHDYLNGLDKGNTYIWLEAEKPDEMAEKSFVVVTNPSSFGGKYLSKPSGILELSFEVPNPDHYKILGRVYAKNGNADSWKFILINDSGDTITNDVWNNINEGKWHNWAWDEITTGRTINEQWHPFLDKGKYTLSFIARDADDCLLDKILITNDILFTGDDSEKSPDENYTYVEAESGKVEAPFKTGKIDGPGEEYVWVEQANAIYYFEIKHPGNYRIWGFVRGENGHSDSVFGSVDDSSMAIWSFAGGGWQSWIWLPFKTKQMEGQAYNFDAGIHKISLNQREADAKVDAFLVTNDLDYTPEIKDCK